MQKKLISVIIPCYNLGAYLNDAVDSVLKQTYKNFEIIIINDGSTDQYTNNLLNTYDKPCCKIIRTENRGLSAARNLGIKHAGGDYIQFLDADDILHYNKFELQTNALKNSNSNSLCYCDYFPSKEDDLNEEFKGRYLSPRFKTDNYLRELIAKWQTKLSIPCHCFLFSSDIFRNNSIWFDEDLPNHEDWECWIKIFALEPEIFFLDQKLVTYRIRSNAMSYGREKMNEGFISAIEKQLCRFGKLSPEHRLLAKRRNQLKYGYGSENKNLSAGIGFFLKGKTKIKTLVKNFYSVVNGKRKHR